MIVKVVKGEAGTDKITQVRPAGLRGGCFPICRPENPMPGKQEPGGIRESSRLFFYTCEPGCRAAVRRRRIWMRELQALAKSKEAFDPTDLHYSIAAQSAPVGAERTC